MGLVEEPEGVRGSHGEAKYVGADNAPDLAALLVAPSRDGVGITAPDVNGPAVAIGRQDLFHTVADIRKLSMSQLEFRCGSA